MVSNPRVSFAGGPARSCAIQDRKFFCGERVWLLRLTRSSANSILDLFLGKLCGESEGQNNPGIFNPAMPGNPPAMLFIWLANSSSTRLDASFTAARTRSCNIS
jgi:hypothetical protein